jgi:hypothetical protein
MKVQLQACAGRWRRLPVASIARRRRRTELDGYCSCDLGRPEPPSGGSAAVELVVLAPILMLFIVFIVMLGRLAAARSEVVAAARTGAQAAVVWGTPGQAAWAADASVSVELLQHHLRCSRANVGVDTSNLRPGGSVRVSVSCTMSMAQLAMPGMPGSKTIAASVVAPVGMYRSVS